MRYLFGRKIYRYSAVDSTNVMAKSLALQGAEEGTVVISETQTKGRGRLGRSWFSPRGGIWLSLILRPRLPPCDTVILTTLAAVAVARSIRKLCEIRPRIRWPNDVLVSGKKVCGILTESVVTGRRVDFVVVGVGLNANFELASLPEKLRGSATTLLHELKVPIDRTAFVRTLLRETERLYGLLLRRGPAKVLMEARGLSSILGRRVEITARGERIVGEGIGFARDGSLKLRTSSGVKTISAADVVRVMES